MEQKEPDAELLNRLKKGERQALADIFEEHSNKLYAIINRLIQNPDQSKDLVQDLFYKIWIGREKLSIRSIQPYLIRAAVNEGLTFLRDNHAENVVSLELVNLASHKERDLEYKELEVLIDRTIGNMPPQRKAVFMLSRFETMTYAEIASHLNISEKTVEKHISIALETLRMALKPHFHLFLILLML